jgi:hypothetical protein
MADYFNNPNVANEDKIAVFNKSLENNIFPHLQSELILILLTQKEFPLSAQDMADYFNNPNVSHEGKIAVFNKSLENNIFPRLVNKDKEAFLTLYKLFRGMTVDKVFREISNQPLHLGYLKNIITKDVRRNATQDTKNQLNQLIKLRNFYLKAATDYVEAVKKRGETGLIKRQSEARIQKMRTLTNNIDEYHIGLYFDSIVLKKPIDFKEARAKIQSMAKDVRNSIKRSHESKNLTKSLLFSSVACKRLDKAINEAEEFIKEHPDFEQTTTTSQRNFGTQ